MKATQEMYDAAEKAYWSSPHKELVRKAVDAALALVPVVEVTQKLAYDVWAAVERAQARNSIDRMREGLQATLPPSFVVAGESQGARLNLVEQRNDWRTSAEQAIARAEAAERELATAYESRNESQRKANAYLEQAQSAEKRLAELEREASDLGKRNESLCLRLQSAQAELARLRAGISGALAKVKLTSDATVISQATPIDYNNGWREATTYARNQFSQLLLTPSTEPAPVPATDDIAPKLAEWLRRHSWIVGTHPSEHDTLARCIRSGLAVHGPAPVPATGAAFQVTEVERLRGLLAEADKAYESQCKLTADLLSAKRAAQGQVVPRVVRELPAKWRRDASGCDNAPADEEEHAEGFAAAMLFAAGDLERALSDAPVSVPASAPAADAATTGEPRADDDDDYNPTPEECARVVKELRIDVPSFAAEIRAKVAAYVSKEEERRGETQRNAGLPEPRDALPEVRLLKTPHAGDVFQVHAIRGQEKQIERHRGWLSEIGQALGISHPAYETFAAHVAQVVSERDSLRAEATPAAPPAGELVERVARLEEWMRLCAEQSEWREGMRDSVYELAKLAAGGGR